MIPDWLWKAEKSQRVRDAQEKGVTINTDRDITGRSCFMGKDDNKLRFRQAKFEKSF